MADVKKKEDAGHHDRVVTSPGVKPKHPPTDRAARHEQWHRCKGCGQPCVVFRDPSTGRAVIGHHKPKELLGVFGRVPCALYARCDTLAFFFREMAGERIAPPDSFDRVLG